jgi:hypothetical protein
VTQNFLHYSSHNLRHSLRPKLTRCRKDLPAVMFIRVLILIRLAKVGSRLLKKSGE